MYTILIVIAAIFVLALLGWWLAELKQANVVYHKNEEEEAFDAQQDAQAHPVSDEELGIKDVIKTISTKGFEA